VTPRRDEKMSSGKIRNSSQIERAAKKPKPKTTHKLQTSPLNPSLGVQALAGLSQKFDTNHGPNTTNTNQTTRGLGQNLNAASNEFHEAPFLGNANRRDRSISTRNSVHHQERVLQVRHLGSDGSEDEANRNLAEQDVWAAESISDFINDYYTFKKVFSDVGGYIVPQEADCDFQFISDVIAGRKSVLPPGTEIVYGPPKSKSINVKKLFPELSVMSPFHQYIKIYPENSFPQKWWFWSVLKYTKRE
jgi:hypothetical protein